MDNTGNRLRKQVIAEVRKRRLIFLTVIFLSFIYLLITLLFGDMGLLKYRELEKKKSHLEVQIKDLGDGNKQLKSQITAIKQDPYIAEKHARENYGLAKPGEIIIQYDK